MAKFKPALYFISKRPSHCGSDEMQCDDLSAGETNAQFRMRGRTQKTQIKEKVMSTKRSTSSCCAIPAVHSAVFVLVYERKSGVD